MENLNLMNFELPRDTNSIIKVVGVGGGGCNAVDHMYRMGIKGVDFIVCNTDQQALDKSPVPVKIPLGITLTEGLGAGSIPEVGKNSAIESIEQIREVLSRKTKMVFITCGMGGGTGTGAAPVIAAAAREMGILTVAIVTIPFSFEGKKRKMQAEHGIEELKKSVDTLLIISNDKLREIYGDLKMTEAFGRADGILTTAAKGIADIITTTLHINTDFADIETVLKDSGVAIMGSASAEGESRALKAVELALASPLLSDSNIRGARHVLLNITCGEGVNEITMDEFGEITDYLQDVAGMSAEVIQGYGIDPSLDNSIKVTIIATGFQNKSDAGVEPMVRKPERKIHQLNEPLAEQKPEVPKAEQSPESVAPSTVVFHEPIQLLEPENEEKDLFSMNNLTPEFQETPSIVATNVDSGRIVHQLHAETEDPEQIIAGSSREFIPAPAVDQNLGEEESQRKLSQERLDRIKRFNFKRNFAEMESKPAYQRKSIVLNNVPPANESNVSRFTLGEGEDQKGEIRGNNSFLHDSVD
jgi:cell division protein FtsZ